MFEVSLSEWFAAAHQLRYPDGTLEPIHGHNWRVTVTWRAQTLDALGVVADFTVLGPALKEVCGRWHDRNLNDAPEFADRNPSAENVALTIAERLDETQDARVRLALVEVEEAPQCIARYAPD